MTFSDSFIVNGTDLGSIITVGSGVPLRTMYTKARDAGKFFVGGNAATVVAAGGYVQGGGHSAFSPMFGLAADNALGMTICIHDIHLHPNNEIYRVFRCHCKWKCCYCEHSGEPRS